ncbi:hypothetical protein VIGAN_06120600, partial [Vigna angularis var. angularis]
STPSSIIGGGALSRARLTGPSRSCGWIRGLTSARQRGHVEAFKHTTHSITDEASPPPPLLLLSPLLSLKTFAFTVNVGSDATMPGSSPVFAGSILRFAASMSAT